MNKDYNTENKRRKRLLGQSQVGTFFGLLVIGLLVSGIFIWGGNQQVAATSEPLVNNNLPGPGGFPGENLYNQYCFGCHGLTGDGNPDADIPALNQNGEAWTKSRTELENHILDGGETMPELSGLVSPDDAAMLIDFIQVWWTQEQIETFTNKN